MPLLDVSNSRVRVGNTLVKRTYLGSEIQSLIPSELFVNGEQGVWYDPSDLSTLFQDSAGTLPVTAMEQPVGRMLDKSGRGNHAVQATTTARPVVSARYNLLTQTEFAGGLADASAQGGNVAATTFPEFAGGVAFTGNSVTSYVYKSPGTLIVGVGVVLSVYVIMDDGNAPVITQSSTTGDFSGVIEVSAAGITSSVVNISGPLYRVSFTKLATTGGTSNSGIVKYNTQSSRTFKVTGYDLRYISDAALPPYQRVTSATDYDTAGFPVYLKPDGVDDWMQTVQNVNLSETAKMSAVIGLTKLTDALRAIAYEHGTSFGLLGNFSFEAPGIAANPHFYVGYNGGSGAATIARTGISAPATLVGTLQNHLDTPWRKLAANKLVPVTNTVDNGAGPFASTIAYLFARTGTQHRFAGRFYGLLIVGRACSDGEMNSMRQYMLNKTRAY